MLGTDTLCVRDILWDDVVEELHLHTTSGSLANLNVEEYYGSLVGRGHYDGRCRLMVVKKVNVS